MTPKPIKEIDLDKVTVHQLLKMLEKGEKDAYYMMLCLKAAEVRGRHDATHQK